MKMEQKDVSNPNPECGETTLSEEKEKMNWRTSWIRWKERFQRMFQLMVAVIGFLVSLVGKAHTGLFKSDGEASLIDDITGAFRHLPLRRKGMGILFTVLILTVYLLSGVYTVKPGEAAVSRIFGKEVRQSITEGLHYRLPWPFEAVEKVNVSEMRRVDVGVPESAGQRLFPKNMSVNSQTAADVHAGHGGHGSSTKPTVSSDQPVYSSKNQFFTGDENILEIRMNIQYQIKDASDYLFKMNSPDLLVPTVARTAVTELFGQMRVDDLLTVGKSSIQKKIARMTQKLLDKYDTGLLIVNVILQEAYPPKDVAQAFRDVASAREEREEKINKAQGYWNTVIPEARGEAHRLISDAEGYKEKVTNEARGDAENFSAMLSEYRRAKDVTEHRLYLETMEKVLAKAKMFVVDSKKERVNLKFVK
jgi:membrane protease subunit HflK